MSLNQPQDFHFAQYWSQNTGGHEKKCCETLKLPPMRSSVLGNLQRFGTFVGRQSNKVFETKAVAIQSQPAKPMANITEFLKSVDHNFSPKLDCSSMTWSSQQLLSLTQRLGWIEHNRSLCKSLDLSKDCYDIQMFLFDRLYSRFQATTDQELALLFAACLVAATNLVYGSKTPVDLGLRIMRSLKTPNHEMMINLVDELNNYVLPKYESSKWAAVTGQSDALLKFLDKDEQVLMQFLMIQRLGLPALIALSNRVQLLVCLVVVELILKRELIKSWACLIQLSNYRILSDYDNATVRQKAGDLYDSLSQLDWQAGARYPTVWFVIYARLDLAYSLSKLPPMFQQIRALVPSTIWLIAPSVILEG
jgi:hypothetical protein